MRKTLRGDAVAFFFAGLPRCLVGMEACSGARDRAKGLSDPGHRVRLMSPRVVTPCVKSGKGERNDAEALPEAVGRASMRVVPQESSGQLARQAVHRIRRPLVSEEGEDAGLDDPMRDLARDVREERADLDRRISICDRRLRELLRTGAMCRRIGRIDGIGPVTATAPVAAAGDRSCFGSVREVAARLGLAPAAEIERRQGEAAGASRSAATDASGR